MKKYLVILLVIAFAISVAIPANAAATNVWVEAESGTIVAPMKVVADAKAAGGKYVECTVANTATNSGTVTIEVNIPVAGNYYIWGLMRAPNGEGNSMFVTVDKLPTYLWDFPSWSLVADYTDIWLWDPVSDRTLQDDDALNPGTRGSIKFNFTAGKHTIVIGGRELGAKLDKLLFTTDLVTRPSGKGGAVAGTTTTTAAATTAAATTAAGATTAAATTAAGATTAAPSNPSTGDAGLIGFAVMALAGASGIFYSRKRSK